MQKKPNWVIEIERNADLMAADIKKAFATRFQHAARCVPKEHNPIAAQTVVISIFMSRAAAILTDMVLRFMGPSLDVEEDFVKGIRQHFAGVRTERSREAQPPPEG